MVEVGLNIDSMEESRNSQESLNLWSSWSSPRLNSLSMLLIFPISKRDEKCSNFLNINTDERGISLYYPFHIFGNLYLEIQLFCYFCTVQNR